MSAGTGQEAGQEFPKDRELVKAPPRGTSYISHVNGESMEPTYHNGDMVFVHACEEIPIGRIGVFLMDGKQWIKELGDGVLISRTLLQKKSPVAAMVAGVSIVPQWIQAARKFIYYELIS